MTLSRIPYSLGLWALLFFFSAGCTRSAPNYKDRTVVKVNQSTLSAAEFSELLAMRLKTFNTLSAKDSAVVGQAKASVVQDFIVQVVTSEWAQARQLFVRKEQLDEAVRKIQKNYPDDLSFRRALAEEGLSFERWEARLNQTLLERLVLDELRKDLKKPTTEQIRAYYQAHKDQFQQSAAVRLRQIVLETEENALRIKKEIQAGKSIASLAKKFSITSEAQSDGDTGWIEKGTLDVFDAAFKMSPGQKSQIVKSPFGYHIFELVAKRPAKTLTVDESSKKIESILSAQAEQVLYSSWLEEQILKARVYKDDEFLKQIQVHSRSE